TALHDASRLLAELSTHTAVVLTPRPASDVLEHLEFMRLRDGQLLAVLVAKSGKVINNIVGPKDSLSNEELEHVQNYLNGILGGLSLEEVRAKVTAELERERGQYEVLEKKALELSAQALPPESVGSEIIIEGQARLLESVGSDADATQLQK